MEVFLIFPKSQQAQQELRDELAKFKTEQTGLKRSRSARFCRCSLHILIDSLLSEAV